MARIEKFEDIEAWQASRDLVKDVYRQTSTGGLQKDYVLRDQIRKAAISVMSNIAEGFERKGDTEFRRFLFIAKASAGEVRSLVYVASDLGYFDSIVYESLIEGVTEVSRKIAAFIRYLDASSTKEATG